MSAEPEPKLEIAHVLTIDVVAYATLLIHEQSQVMADLTRVVRSCSCFRHAEAEGKLIRLPTGDGMALVFFTGPEAPVECAMQLAEALRELPHIRLRMGIHSGPVNQVVDVNDRTNVAGAGIDIAQRVMDCGDAGHILLSKRAADDLAPYPRWNKYLHELGEVEVKHGRRLSVVNFYTGSIGNPELPGRWRKSAPAAAPPPAGPGRPSRAILAGALVLLAGLALVAAIKFSGMLDGRRIVERSIAVLPFKDNSPTRDQEYFTDGIAEQISNALVQIGGLRVIPRTSAFAFKNRELDAREIGRRLGVAYLLEGSVNRAEGKTRVITNLIEIASGYNVLTVNYDSSEQDILSLQNDVAKRVAHKLRVKLQPGEEQRLVQPPTRNEQASDLYMQGRYHLNRRTRQSLAIARQLFEQSVAADPQFALGYVGAADAYIQLGKIGVISGDAAAAAARPQVTRAIELDDRLADAYVSRAILANDFEWNWAAAEADYRRALAINPDNASACHWFARHQAQLGHFDEALRLVQRAQELDPFAPMIRVTHARILIVARRSHDALAPCQEALGLEPQFASAFSVLAQARALQGDHAGALDAVKQYVALSDESGWAQLELAYTHAVAGDRAEAERLMRVVTEQERSFSPYDMGTIHAALGQPTEAIAWLERAIAERSVDVIWIRVDPRVDPVRADPAFQRVVTRLVPRS